MAYAIQNAIPGLGGMTQSATSIIQNALSGLPSPSESRLANAYFGSRSGLGTGTSGTPTDDFLTNRGYDLYKLKGEQRQRGGIQDLLSLVGGFSGTVAPTPGQELQNTQFGQNLAQQGSQFNQNLGLQNRTFDQQKKEANRDFDFGQQQWQTQLDLLKQYLGPAGGITY